MIKLKTYKTYCGKKYENPRQYSGHITNCEICKNEIKKEKENWNVKCKCGCGKITKYKKTFYNRRCYYDWKKNDVELRNRISNSVKKLYENDEYRNFISEKTKLGMKKYIEKNKDKFKYKKYKRKTINDRELSQLKSRITKDRWKDEDYRKRLLISQIKAIEVNNERRKKSLMEMWKNRSHEDREKLE